MRHSCLVPLRRQHIIFDYKYNILFVLNSNRVTVFAQMIIMYEYQYSSEKKKFMKKKIIKMYTARGWTTVVDGKSGREKM